MGSRYQSNTTQMTEFILIDFQLSRPIELFLFSVFLLVFFLTLAGNLTIITLVYVNQRLQTPMYFFLCNLSFLEMLFVLTIRPKMLVSLISLKKIICFAGCFAQCYFSFSFSLGTCECILIALMAFDCYVAICYPLRYTIIMNEHLCVFLALGCWTGGLLLLLIPVSFLLHLSFCGSNLIDHYFCDYAPIIKLSCSKNMNFLLVSEIVSSLAVRLTSISINGISYLYIISTVLRMHSTKGQKKTFSTCASHITVASIFYGSSIFMYSLPTKGCSWGVQKAVALLTAVITPLLNPFIYTLRNQKIKEVLKDCLKNLFPH